MANTKKAAEGTQVITINRPKTITTNITIIGDTPLIVHAWSEKAKKEMLAAQQKTKKAKKAMDIRDPFAEFMNTLYWITKKPEQETPEAFEAALANGAKFGFPTICFKLAALAAAYRAGVIPNQVGMKCSFWLEGIEKFNPGSGSGLVLIESSNPPRLQEDMVRIGGINKTADLRYRAVFDDWKVRLKVSLIDTGTFNMESVINAIEMGGLMCGVGEWRMEKNGEYGQYHVQIDGEEN